VAWYGSEMANGMDMGACSKCNQQAQRQWNGRCEACAVAAGVDVAKTNPTLEWGSSRYVFGGRIMLAACRRYFDRAEEPAKT